MPITVSAPVKVVVRIAPILCILSTATGFAIHWRERNNTIVYIAVAVAVTTTGNAFVGHRSGLVYVDCISHHIKTLEQAFVNSRTTFVVNLNQQVKLLAQAGAFANEVLPERLKVGVLVPLWCKADTQLIEVTMGNLG